MTDTRKMLLDDQRLFADPEESRRYVAFRRQFAAELYLQLLETEITPLTGALLDLSSSDRQPLVTKFKG